MNPLAHASTGSRRSGLLLLGALLLLTGCTNNFQTYFVPADRAPLPAATQQVQVIKLGEQAIEPNRQSLYPNARVLGRSHFTSSGGDSTAELETFAKTIGSDVVLWRQAWLGATAESGYDPVTSDDTRIITTKRSDGTTTKTVITDRRTDLVPYVRSRDRYINEALFLRQAP